MAIVIAVIPQCLLKQLDLLGAFVPEPEGADKLENQQNHTDGDHQPPTQGHWLAQKTLQIQLAFLSRGRHQHVAKAANGTNT